MKVEQVQVSVYRIPTDQPEADGTVSWDSTTVVLVEVLADGGQRGLGFSDASAAAATLVHEKLALAVLGGPVDAPEAAWTAMIRSVRNVGQPGIAATAISAVDIAL